MWNLLRRRAASPDSIIVSESHSRSSSFKQLPKRTVAALTGGFVLVTASLILLGPSLRSVLAEDDHAEHLRQLRAERGQSEQRYAPLQQAQFRPQQAPLVRYASQVRGLFTFPIRTAPVPLAAPAHAPSSQPFLAYAPATQSINAGLFPQRSGLPAAPQARRATFLAPRAAHATSTQTVLSGATLSQRSVCVRLCDGFYYPVGDYNGPSDNDAHSAVCAGMCPGAPTRLYVAPAGSEKIEDAISIRDGRSYKSLPVAFRHTAKRDKTCSCHGPEDSVVNSVSLLKDFTLRRGDRVMTQSGFRIFRGAASLPYRQADFTSLSKSRDLTRQERGKLRAIERASGTTPVKLASQRPLANDRSQLATPISYRTVTDPTGKSVRLIGPQAMLLQNDLIGQP